MRNWTPAVPIAAALGFSAAVFGMLPLEVRPALGALLPMALPDDGDALPRSAAALLLPAIAALMWALFAWGARIKGPQRPFPAWLASEATTADAVARFASTYATLIFTLVTLVALMHLVMLGSVIGWPAWTFQIFTAALGLAMLTAGNVIPRSRPNWIVGIRTKGTLASAEVWMRTHRLLGAFLMAAGALVIVASVVAPSYAVLIAVAGALLALVVAHQLGARGRRDGAGSVVALGLVSVIHAYGIVGVAGAQTPSALVDTVAPRGVIEQEVGIHTADIVLPATLTTAERVRGAVPIVVMVAGSGPTDRNGNGPLVQTNMYAQIAWQLARRGIATLRYDKRGIGESARTLDHSRLSVDDYVADVKLTVAMVRGDARFSRVYVLGHSEGAMLALLAANRGAAVDGIIMLGGTGRRLSVVLHDQFKLHVDSATLAQIDAAWDRFLLGEDPGPVPPIAQPVFVVGYRRFLQSMDAYDPVGELGRVSVPVMLVQGGMDWQVTMDDATRLRTAKPQATWLFIPEANHLFKAASSNAPGDQQQSYHDKSIGLVPTLVPGIAAFVGTVRPAHDTNRSCAGLDGPDRCRTRLGRPGRWREGRHAPHRSHHHRHQL